MVLDGVSPLVIPHPFLELPAKVDVQVKVVHEGNEYIFPGLGSAQRDDDLVTDYGGVGYLYNDIDVKIYVPVTQNNGNGPGRVLLTAAPYTDVIHNLGVYPDFVTVQLLLSDGYVSDAQGTTPTTLNHGPKWINSCGTVFGITESSVTLWGASEADDFIACFKDGWGSEDVSYSSADVIIRAWILSSQETKDSTVSSGTTFYGAGSASLGDTAASDPFGGTLYGYNQSHVLLWTPDVAYGYPIYVGGVWGSGTQSIQASSVVVTVRVITTGRPPGEICPLPPSLANGYSVVNNHTAVYHCSNGYIANQTDNVIHCNNSLWEQINLSCEVMSCPVPHTTANTLRLSDGTQNGSLTLYSCVRGYSGNGGNGLISCNGTHWSDTNLTCTGFVANDGYQEITCNGSHWSPTQYTCSSIMCAEPPSIPNTVKISDGYQNGSMTLYSCQQGFYGNDGYPFITCNGTHWSDTVFVCSDSIISPASVSTVSCELPPSIPNAFYDVNSSTATYYCHHGYTANDTNNVIRCINSHWSYITLACLNVTCGEPPSIQNAMKTSDGFQNGSITMYSCLSGYSSNNGYPLITCNGTHWSNTSFLCAEISCPNPPDIADALKTSSGRTNGSVTLYSCLSGFTANNADPLICCIGDQWTGTNYTCLVEPVPCDSPLPLANADVFWNTSMAMYTCRAGYRAYGDVHWSACHNGVWTSVSGVCQGSNVTNTTNFVLSPNAFEGLRIPRHNTSAYERSLISAYDPRQSAKAIGSVGALIIVVTVGLICLSDCVTLCSQKELTSKNPRL
ncbi:sushi, von Willebrand factor type A, EGF and pentraxin domain-containing protein 1-like [Ostrea edulis]|uniref:sushi, von Willebrand factor type A, EGF and pentraxin domain-containing protein 1-like n=1 Tax=Ostrea edulis TaxID=37623 RepID=UPI0024AEF79A|nr:sushi, von Willebrand factor type A, EGF and pentraxin domain-containing protein 1-like [Ostrea edulis]